MGLYTGGIFNAFFARLLSVINYCRFESEYIINGANSVEKNNQLILNKLK